VIVLTAPGEPGLPQVGFVAGRRVGNAVRRNRSKRRLRAAMEQLPLAPDTAYLVIAGSETATVEFGRLVAWLAESLGLDGGEKEQA
jgi:ribonuclease P protein component